MNIKVWADLVRAYDDMTREISSAPPPKAPGDLGALRVKLWDKLVTLKGDLTELTSPEQARRLLRPLVFLVDERVLAKLPPEGGVDWWSALQRDFAVDGGGEVFFEDVRRLTGRRMGEASEPQVDVTAEYLFCLRAGFRGRYFEDLAALRDAGERLAEELPRPAAIVGAAVEEGAVARPRGLWAYVGAAVAAVLVLQVVLVVVGLVF